MNPAHETRMDVAGGERQDVAHEFVMHIGQIGRSRRKIAMEPSTHLVWDWLPDRTFPDIFDVIENIVEHAVRLGPEGRPIGRVERPALVRRKNCAHRLSGTAGAATCTTIPEVSESGGFRITWSWASIPETTSSSVP